MMSSLHHRGPNNGKTWLQDGYALGFQRLSIIDLSEAGNQPYVSDCGQVVTLCNGEIYNHQALRSELEKQGARFHSLSDSEVVLHAYLAFGESFVDQLNGMFAIAILDLRSRQLLLIRDRVGIKPLYYGWDQQAVWFGSELKALTADPAFPKALDPLALNLYFVRDNVPAPYTVYKAARKVSPGELVRIDLDRGINGISQRRYWQLTFGADHAVSASHWQEELLGTIDQVVAEHMMSDVPLGAFLSGGIDSSTIVASMCRASSRVRTFTVGFENEQSDERKIAKDAAAHWGTQHIERVLAYDGASVFSEAMSVYDEPFGDTSALPTYLVSRMAAEHVTVVLSGDGGDELFSGYLSTRQARLISTLGRIPHKLRAGLLHWPRKLLDEAKLSQASLPTWLMLAMARHHVFDRHRLRLLKNPWQVETDEILSTYEPLRTGMEGADPIDAYFTALFAQYLPDDILTKVDRASSAHSLEARVPLVDHRLAEIAARIPHRYKMREGVEKWILRQAVGQRFPSPILNHEKRGFGLPWASLDQPVWKNMLRDSRTSCPELDEVINFQDEHEWSGMFGWRLLAFCHWYANRPG